MGNVRILKATSVNGMRLQPMPARTDVECADQTSDFGQWHATSTKHVCTDIACVHLESNVGKEHAALATTCTDQLCLVLIN